ncbi:MAG: dTMP kinase [Campylobacteraceae bacterium]|nr:dTMP kinase [Campylobacteraceae bacterium]
MIIWFEGVDTSGKSTQIERLSKTYKDAIITKEPGGTELGVAIRELILHQNSPISSISELFLFLADRAEHYEKVISKNKHRLILSDRGFISGMAYALANGLEADLGLLFRLNRLALGGSFSGKIVFFETTAELISSRLKTKNSDIIESRGSEYLMNVQNWMKQIVTRLEMPVLYVNSALNEASIEDAIKGFLND